MQQKNTRRGRKDPQSRDFTCRCGRSYLSYAAAYTHVKNKHQLDKAHLQDIGRPQRQKLKRGRPKDRKELFSNVQVEELSILEEAILRMYQLLNAKFNHMILEGNNTLDVEELQRLFNALSQQCAEKTHLKFNRKGSENELRFIRDLNRHFTGEVAARVKVAVMAIGELREREEVGEGEGWTRVEDELNVLDLWEGENEVNKILCSTVEKWEQVRADH